MGGFLILFGVWPASGASAAATAAFPFDVYFDLEQLLLRTSSWTTLVPLLILALVIRASILAGTVSIALTDGQPFRPLWARATVATSIGAALFVPAAALMLAGVGIRYAPFVGAGAIFGWVAAVVAARRAIGSFAPDTSGESRRKVPPAGDVLFYALFLSVISALLSVLSNTGRFLPALFVAFLGPIHALILLGWLGTAPEPGTSREGRFASIVVAVLVVVLASASLFDRSIRNAPPVANVGKRGSLLLLGGVDSTATTGALTELDARDVGMDRARARLLSYREDSSPYTADDTHGDLDVVARTVARQISEARPPVHLLGHSQASLILDRIERDRSVEIASSAELAPPPPGPPPISIPQPGLREEGKPAGDLVRALSGVLEVMGMPGFDIDGPASPLRLETVVVEEPATERLAVWALGDSVWLTGDWRRPGSINVVAITDHVGVTNNGHALEVARSHLSGGPVADDSRSWRGALVGVFRYLFEPWKPVSRA